MQKKIQIFYVKQFHFFNLNLNSYKVFSSFLCLNYLMYFKLFLTFFSNIPLILKPINSISTLFKFKCFSESKWFLIMVLYVLFNKFYSCYPLKKFKFFFTPNHKTLFSIIRPPFVFKKSKEQFVLESFRVIFFVLVQKNNFISYLYLKTINQLNLSLQLRIKWSTLFGN